MNREAVISVADVAGFIRRNLFLFLGGFLLTSVAVFSVSFLIEPQFKSRSSISLQSSYFRNPLVSDLVSEEHDHTELRAQREALLRLALRDEFLDELVHHYNLYPGVVPEDYRFGDADEETASVRVRNVKRRLLLDDIEYFPLNTTTYQLSVIAADPHTALLINKDIVSQVTETLSVTRRSVLERTRDAVRTHIRELGITLRTVEDSERFKDYEQLQQELQRVEADLEVLLLNYTEKHPKVVEIKRKESSLQRLLEAMKKRAKPKQESAKHGVVTVAAKQPIQDVYNELLKRLSDLDIVLDIEESGGDLHVAVIEEPMLPLKPFAPNKAMFALFAAVTGLLAGAFLITIREVRNGMLSEGIPEIAERKGLPFLGELPLLPDEKLRLALPGSSFSARLSHTANRSFLPWNRLAG